MCVLKIPTVATFLPPEIFNSLSLKVTYCVCECVGVYRAPVIRVCYSAYDYYKDYSGMPPVHRVLIWDICTQYTSHLHTAYTTVRGAAKYFVSISYLEVCVCVSVTCESLCTEFAAKWLDYRNDRGDREEHTSSDGSSMHINSTRHLVFSHRTESELVCYLDLYASTSLVCVNSFSVRVCFWRVEMDVVFVHVLMQWGSERKRSSLCVSLFYCTLTPANNTLPLSPGQ